MSKRKKITPEIAQSIAERVALGRERMADIAKEFGRTPDRMLVLMSRHGVSINRIRNERNEQMIKDRQAGMSLADIATAYGVTKKHAGVITASRDKQDKENASECLAKPKKKYVGIPAGKPYVPRWRIYKPDRKMQGAYEKARAVYADKTVRGM